MQIEQMCVEWDYLFFHVLIQSPQSLQLSSREQLLPNICNVVAKILQCGDPMFIVFWTGGGHIFWEEEYSKISHMSLIKVQLKKQKQKNNYRSYLPL